jgi:hypothetical protein
VYLHQHGQRPALDSVMNLSRHPKWNRSVILGVGYRIVYNASQALGCLPRTLDTS